MRVERARADAQTHRPAQLKLRSANGWTEYVVFCRGAVLAHKLLGAFAEARELSPRRSCRPRASRPVSFSRRSSTGAASLLDRSFLRFRPGLPLGQREIQTGGMPSDRRLTAAHLGGNRSDKFPGRGQSLKNDIFM